jgi:hypothetical protein
MSDEQREQPAPEPEKEQQIEFGTERPEPHEIINSEDGAKKPQQ